MKRNIKLIVSVLALVFVIVIVFCLLKPKSTQHFVPRPRKVEDIEFILIKSAFGFDKPKILKPNAAVLITDKKEIIEDQQWFLAPKENDFMSGNGSIYSVQFWKNSQIISHDIGIDGFTSFSFKPEESYKRLQLYKNLLEKAPTHYIYNLKLYATFEPRVIMNLFKKTDLKILFVDNTLFRYPNANLIFRHTLYASKNATEKERKSLVAKNSEITEKTIKSIIAKIRTVTDIVHQSIIYSNYSGGNGKSYSELEDEVILHFKLGTDIKAVERIINQQKGKVGYFEVPKYYNVQLVDTRSNLDDVRKEMKKYKFIKDVSEYTDPYKK